MKNFFKVHINEEFMSLESSSFYNIIMFIFGVIALIFNTLEIIVNINNGLYKQSLYNCIRLYSNFAGVILAVRNFAFSAINLCYFDSNWFFTSENVCLGRSIIDVTIVNLFQGAYAVEIVTFAISIVYPIFFMRHVDNKHVKISLGFGILSISFLAACMMLIGRGRTQPYPGFCVIYNNWTPVFQDFHCFLTAVIMIVVIATFFKTRSHIRHMSSEEKFRRNICSFMCWSMLFFLIFGVLPNALLVVSFFMNLECNFKNVCLDAFYLTVCISIILPFPFALWKNKLIRRHFLELPCVPHVVNKVTTTKTTSLAT
uniref:G_PROTEIN_RECEP_F1_2 domain-containing protein n=1 Tax=Strongyloides papillosus TaxID=174720 RepID=A0A0N5CGB0_STREA